MATEKKSAYQQALEKKKKATGSTGKVKNAYDGYSNYQQAYAKAKRLGKLNGAKYVTFGADDEETKKAVQDYTKAQNQQQVNRQATAMANSAAKTVGTGAAYNSGFKNYMQSLKNLQEEATGTTAKVPALSVDAFSSAPKGATYASIYSKLGIQPVQKTATQKTPKSTGEWKTQKKQTVSALQGSRVTGEYDTDSNLGTTWQEGISDQYANKRIKQLEQEIETGKTTGDYADWTRKQEYENAVKTREDIIRQMNDVRKDAQGTGNKQRSTQRMTELQAQLDNENTIIERYEVQYGHKTGGQITQDADTKKQQEGLAAAMGQNAGSGYMSGIKAYKAQLDALNAQKNAGEASEADTLPAMMRSREKVNSTRIKTPLENQGAERYETSKAQYDNAIEQRSKAQKNLDRIQERLDGAIADGDIAMAETLQQQRDEIQAFIDNEDAVIARTKGTATMELALEDKQQTMDDYKTMMANREEVGTYESEARSAADFAEKSSGEGVTSSTGHADYYTIQHEMVNLGADYQGAHIDSDMADTMRQYGADMLSEDEIAVYNYYYNNGEKEKADAYLTALSPTLRLRRTEALNEDTYAYAQEHPILATAESAATNVANSFLTPWQWMGAAMGSTDTNNVLYDQQNRTNYLRSGAGQTINDEVTKLLGNEKSGEVAQWFYNAGNSAIDSFISTAIGSAVMGVPLMGSAAMTAGQHAGVQAISLGIMSSQAASQTLKEKLDSGMEPNKAILYSAVYGGIEAFTEIYSVEALLGDPTDMALYLLKNFVAEGGEEIEGDFIRPAVDWVIARATNDKTELEQTYDGYIRQGMSSNQAAQHTFGDWLVDTILDGLAGGVSGLGSSVVYGGVNKAKAGVVYTKLGSNVIDNQTVDNVLSVAETLPQTSEAYKLAQAIKDGSKKNNAYNVGRLLQMTMNATGNAASVLEEQFVEDVQRRLEQKGETENTEEVAKAAAQLLMTGQVTEEQAQVLAESEHGLEVLDEASQAQENQGRLEQVRKTGEQMGTIAEAMESKEEKTKRNGTEQNDAGNIADAMDSQERETIGQAKAEDRKTGEAVEVQGISQTSRTGTATVTVTKGGTVQQVNLEDVSFNNERQETAYRVAAQMETPTKGQAFLDVLKKTTMPVDTARAAFNAIYNAGSRGLSLDASTVTTRYAELLGTDATLDAYEYGAKEQARQNERLAFDEDVTQTLKDTIAALPDSVDDSYTGVIYKGSKKSKLSTSMAAQVEVLHEVAKRYALQVEVVDQAGEGSMKGKINGQYIRGTNRIQVSLDSDQGLLTAALAHEMTHFISQWNETGYNDLAGFIGSKLAETDGYSLSERIEEKIEQYKQGGVELTKEQAVEEIIADSMFRVFENEQYVQDLMEQHQTLGEKIKGKLKNFVQELKQLAKNLKSPEARAMAKQEAETVEQMTELFNNAAVLANAKRQMQQMQEKMENAPISEKFQMKEDVERVGDLIAVHNMDSGYLEQVLKNGGIIAPSIAVRLAKIGWNEYGDVSLIYDASAIDPEANEWNNVFNDDAFTQVTPRSYYKVNVDGIRNLLQQVEQYAEDMSTDRAEGLKHDIETMIRHAEANADNGTGEGYLIRDDYQGLRTIVNQLSQAAIQEYGRDGISDAGERAQARDAWTDARMGELSDGKEFYRMETMKEVEEQAAQDDDSFDDDDWFDDDYKPKETKKTKKKVKSFEYMPASEENALKVNRSESARNAESGTGGYYQARAALTQKFTSLDEIKRNKFQLDPDDETLLTRWKKSDAAVKEIQDVCRDVEKITRKTNKGLRSREIDNIVLRLVSDRASMEEMTDALQDIGVSHDEAEFFAVRLEDAIEQGERAFHSANFMFEAKPIRKVENKGGIRAAVVPEGYWAKNPNAARMAAEQGIQMLEYNGTNADRTRVMNSELLADARFSLKEDTGVLASLQGVDKINENMRQQIEDSEDFREVVRKLQRVMNSRGGIQEVQKKYVNKLAGELVGKWTPQGLSKNRLAQNLTTAFDAMANAKTTREAEIAMQAMADIAQDLIERSGEVDNETAQEYAEFRNYMKSRSVKLTDNQWQEVKSKFGSAKEFRRAYAGIFVPAGQTVTDAPSLDAAWGEICEMAKGYLDPNTNEGDQVEAIMEALEATAPKIKGLEELAAENGETYNPGQLASMIAMDIYDHYMDMPTLGTLQADAVEAMQGKIDSQNREIGELKKEISQARKQIQRQRTGMTAMRTEALERMKRKDTARYETEEKSKTRREIIRTNNRIAKKLNQPNATGFAPWNMRQSVEKLMQMTAFTDMRNGETGDSVIREDVVRQAKDAYMELTNDKAGEADEAIARVKDFYNGDLEFDFDHLLQKAVGKKLSQLDQQDLNALKNVLNGYAAAIINADTMFLNDRKTSLSEKGDTLMSQVGLRKAHKKQGAMERMLTNSLGKGLLKPTTVFHKMEGTAMQEVWQNLRNAEGKHVTHVEEASNYLQEALEKYDHQKVINQSQKKQRKKKNGKEFRLKSGKTIKLTTEELLTITATWKREQQTGTQHLLKGGMTLQEAQKGSSLDAIHLTEEDLTAFENALTEQEKEYREHMVKYLSTECSKWGNEVTRQMYGVDKFGESYYIPFQVDRNVLKSDPAQAQDQRLKVGSFTKALTPKASNTIQIVPFTQLWCSHVEKMSDYNAFVLPIEDMTRLMNYKTEAGTMKQAINKAYGVQQTQYIMTFLKNLNGNARPTDGDRWLRQLSGAAKGAAVTFNVSVALQQAGAGVRAAAEIDAKYIMQGMAKGINFKKSYAELEKYAPIAVLKGWGYFDTQQSRGLYDRNTENWKSKLNDLGGKMPEMGDQLNWAQIWEACKAEQRAELQGENEETILKAAGSRFQDVIDKTQVVDSIFQRAQWAFEPGRMRDSFLNFMSEPITQYNMLYRSIWDVADAYQNGGMNAKPGETYKATRAKAIRKALAGLGKNIAAVTTSMGLTAGLKTIATALRSDDDEKKEEGEDGKTRIVGRKTFWEKYQENYWGDFWSSLVGLVPVYADMFSALTSTGYSSNDDLEMQGLNYLQKMAQQVQKIVTGESDDYGKALYYLTTAVSYTTGIGFNSLLRDTNAIFTTTMKAMDTEFVFLKDGQVAGFREMNTTAWDSSKDFSLRVETAKTYYCYSKSGMKEQGNEAGNRKQSTDVYVTLAAYAYYNYGIDSEEFQKASQAAIDMGATASGFTTAVKNRIKDTEPAVREAAEALIDGDMETYREKIAEIMAGGVGSKPAEAMVKGMYNSMLELPADDPENAGEVKKKLKKNATASSTAAAGMTTDTLEAAAAGKNEAGYLQAVNDMKTLGYTDAQIKTKTTKLLKTKYRDACWNGNTEEAATIGRMATGANVGITNETLFDWANDTTPLYEAISENDADTAAKAFRYIINNAKDKKTTRKNLDTQLKKKYKAATGEDKANMKALLLKLGYSEKTINSWK